MTTYDDRFAKQREELIAHFDSGLRLVGQKEPSAFQDPHFVDVQKSAIAHYAQKQGYFRLTPQERTAIETEPAFADDSARSMEKRWLQSAVRDIMQNMQKFYESGKQKETRGNKSKLGVWRILFGGNPNTQPA